MDSGGDRGAQMATVPGTSVRSGQREVMRENAKLVDASCGPSAPRAPARVRLRRITASQAIPYPPRVARDEWWARLKAALGTCSSAFVQAALAQLIGACRLPGSGISEVGVNAALAFIEAVKPRDEVEAALALQMASNHSAIMNIFARFHGDFGRERHLAVGATALAKLQRAFAFQVETLRRLRNGGSQTVRVEHVYVATGAQAVIGAVSRTPCAGPG